MHREGKTVHKQFASLQERFCVFAGTVFSHSEEQHQVHEEECRNNAPATKKMPCDDKNYFCSKSFKALWFAPFTIYFDFESFLMPVSTYPANPDASSIEVIE